MSPMVVVVGEALVDQLPGGPVAAGAPLNVARHLRALGGAPLLISRIGQQDQAATRVERAMRAFDLSLAGLQRDPLHPTGTVRVWMQPGGGHRFEIASDAAWDHLDAALALATLRAGSPSLLYFGTLAQRHPISRAAIGALLTRSTQLRVLDLNLREGVSPGLALDSVRQAHWLKLCDGELAQLQTWSGCGGAADLVRHFGLKRLIVTRGAAGYYALDAQGAVVAEGEGVPVPSLVDTVGAGDAFCACLLAAHLQRKDWAASLDLANRFAAAICGQAGASPSDPASFYPPWQARLVALPESLHDVH